MGLLRLLKDIITEDVSIAPIRDAIHNTHVVELKYMDDAKLPGGSEVRIIYPVAYGSSLKDNPVFRAYQISGPSLKVDKRGVPLPDWRLFRKDRVQSFKLKTGEDTNFVTFTEPPLYNPVGDNSMVNVQYNATF
tara:strand:+ start:4029 stop:4430 length:402 start_codon:yes stop_codon:yes gene_type:complete